MTLIVKEFVTLFVAESELATNAGFVATIQNAGGATLDGTDHAPKPLDAAKLEACRRASRFVDAKAEEIFEAVKDSWVKVT